jgi:hypothetical protein
MTSTRRDLESAPLLRRLAGLRRRLRLVVSLRGLSWLLTAVLTTAVVVGLADWRWHLPGLVRAFALTGLLAGAGVILYRFLLRPLSAPSDDLSLALRVEERYPTLNDALASTVQFLDRADPPEGESASMRQEAVRRTLGKAGGIDFNRVVETKGLRTAGACSLLSTAAAAVLIVLAPSVAATALARLANPFGDVEWPRKTRLKLDHVVKKIGRNREYRLRGIVHGVVPSTVSVELFYEGFPMQRRTFAVRTSEEGDSFVMHLKPEEVQRNFRFHIVANDAVTRDFNVEVLPLPVLALLDGKPSPQVRLDFPRYTDLPTPQHLTPGTGNVEAVTGTIVTYRAAVDRPLKRAWVEYQPEVREAPVAAFLAPMGSTMCLEVLTSVALTRTLYEPIAATLSDDRQSLTACFRPALHGMYVVHFEDENELENSRTYELRLRPDPAPVVRLDRPSATRDVLTVLPTAQLPLELAVEDMQFAVRSVWIEYRTQANDSPRMLTLYDHARGLNRDAASLAGLGALLAPRPRLRLQRLDFNRTLSLRSIRHASGEPLKEGDTVILQACADDFDDVSPGKEPGRSHQIEIRIISRQAMEQVLTQEQARVQQELVRLREKEREARSKVAEIEMRLRKGGKVAPEREATEAEAQAQKAQEEATAETEKAEKAASPQEREKHQKRAEELREKAKEHAAKAEMLRKQASQLSEAEQLQQQIRERVGDRKEGLRAEVERLRQTLRQNNMENSNAMMRMTAVANELDRLAERELENIEPKLINARKMAELLDEKTRQERMAELEKQAKDAEQQARDSEALAQKLNEKAAQAEQAAGNADDEQQKERKAAEGKQLRQQAQQQLVKAAEKRAQAQRDRRDAAMKPDPDRPRRELAEARRGQETVEDRLTALLQRLEPWSSTAEIKGEAGKILQEQKDLMAQAEEMEKKNLGKSLDELTPGEKADLDNLQDMQRRLQERTAELIEKMKKVAEKRAEKDPQTAQELKNAAEDAEKGGLTGQMKEAGENIKKNRLSDARKKQREALAELERLTKNLEDRREAELDRLRKKLREMEEQIERLQDEQEKLQRKIREANKIADAQKRQAELEKLARKQQELKEQTAKTMEELAKLGNDRAREALAKAGEEMEEAFKQLKRRKPQDEKQEDVLDRLEEARQELERARKKAEEELGREQIARVADKIQGFRERQQAFIEEAKRIQDSVLKLKSWNRALKASLLRLGDNQKDLGKETADVAKKDLSAAPIFARMLERSARAMRNAGERLDEMGRQSPDLQALPDADAARFQELALRRLNQLLDSLKESMDNPTPLSRGGGGGGDDGGMGGPQGDDSLPPLAQLKMLLSMEKEIKVRTDAFKKKHPNLANLGPKEKAELQDIQREQKEVADLVDRYTQPPGEDPDDDEEMAKEKGNKEGEKK